MKRLFIVCVFLGALLTMQAQFVDFGTGYNIQRGDFAVADIDNDGDLDIIFSAETTGNPNVEKGAVLINDGTGGFTVQEGERVIRMGKSGNIQYGDIDGDGDLDVIFGGWGVPNITKAGIALNNGAGVYTLASTELYPVNPAEPITSCGFADFDMNGLPDYYFFANGLGNSIIYFQQPDGTFLPSAESFATINFIEPEVTIGDFDNDHYPDIFITAAVGSNRFSALFKNDGFGNFTQFAGVDIYRKKANGTTSWGDFNGDGYLDLLLNGDGFLNSGEDNDRIARIYKNENGMSASVAQTYEQSRQAGVGNGNIIVDWDNDGDLDFFLGGWNGTKQETSLYLCDDPATMAFTKSPLSDTYFPGISEQGFRVADLNGDNKVDLLICGYSGGTLDLKRRIAGYVVNQSTVASVPPAAPTGLNVNIDDSDGLMLTFSWDAPQSEAGKIGTTYNLSLRNITTGKWLYNPMAVVGGERNGWRKVAGRMGNVFTNTEYELYDLPDGQYEWTVQAINGAYLGGAFAATQTFTIGEASGIDQVNDPVPSVYAEGKNLTVKASDGALQSLKVYNAGGLLIVSTAFAGNTQIELPAAGLYVVEVSKAGAAPFHTKVLVK
jgi:hypothetical protein